MKEGYDIVIIGAGLGGLECGVTLSKEGYRVCVLEKNTRPGGCLQSFYRKGYLLDTGIHYIGSMDEGKILRQYFHYFGILDELKMQRLDQEAFDVVSYQGKEYPYAMGQAFFVERLAEYFPAEYKNLCLYAGRLKEIGELISVEHLKQGNLSAGGWEYFGQSAWEEIQKITADVVLQQVLAGTNLLYGGIRDKSTFYHHAMINNSNLDGAYRFTGGSMQLANSLAGKIKANGGDVFCNAEVKRIIVENRKVTAVETWQGEKIAAKYVISAIHPQLTLKLTDKNHLIRKAYISRIHTLENSYGVFTAYLMMKKDCFPYFNKNYYFHTGRQVWYDQMKKGQENVCMASMSANVDHGAYTDVVSLIAPMEWEQLRLWEDTGIGKRGMEYEEFKEKKAKALVDMIAPYFPGLKENIEEIFVTTPLSFRDFTGTVDGSAYGVVKDYRQPLTTLISPRTKIENLLLTGQNLNVHGALGVTLTAMLTCAELLGKAYLAKKVSRA